ncbi:hypothetical protein [Ilumatobacter sp.]|uniref:hypothetical protein n=1 Tax=Ilumatobacter sp. TaxID=1967498 RepID=UPI003C3BCE50
MNRRLMTILLPLTATALTAGCSTFSDNDAIARVGDVKLSEDGLDDLLDEQAVPDEQRADLDLVRPVISGWIESTAIDTGQFSPEMIQEIPDDELARVYRQGMETSGVTCADLLVASTVDEAEQAADELRDGADFEVVFDEFNTDPSLVDVGGDAGCFDITQLTAQGEPSAEVLALMSVTSAEPIAIAPSTTATGDEAGLLISFQDIDTLSDEEQTQVLDLVRQTSGVRLVLDDLDVHVDSRYGYFDRATGAVTPLG